MKPLLQQNGGNVKKKKALFLKLFLLLFVITTGFLWYMHIDSLYIDPEYTLRRFEKDTNQKVIDFVKFEDDDEIRYIFYTEGTLGLRHLEKRGIFWHLSCTVQRGRIGSMYHPYFAFSSFPMNDTFIIYGCPVSDEVAAIRLIIDDREKITDETYHFENNSKLFWFDLGMPQALFKEIVVEVINKDEEVISREVLYKNNLW